MDNYEEIKNNANEARKNNNWQLAFDLYKKIIADYKQDNLWDEYFLALSSFNLMNYNQSLSLCREIHKKNKNFNPNKNLYARSIVHSTLQRLSDIDEGMIIKAFDAVKKLVGTNDKYMKYDYWFIKILKQLLKDKQFFKAKAFIEWANIDDFSNVPREIEIDGKKRETASCLEDLLVESAKLYFSLNYFDKSLEIIDSIFNKISKLHYSNHVWLKRLKARIFAKKAEYEKAVELYFIVLKTKTDWFIYFELAKILLQIKNIEASIFFMAKALKESQNIKFKIKLLEFILQNEIDKFDLPTLAALFCAVYKENGWKIKDRVIYLCKMQNIECENIEKKTIYQRKIMNQANNIIQGKTDKAIIIKIFNKYSGLLKNNDSTYFFVSKKADVKTNDLVIYRLNWSYDFKKKKLSQSAIVIDIIK